MGKPESILLQLWSANALEELGQLEEATAKSNAALNLDPEFSALSVWYFADLTSLVNRWISNGSPLPLIVHCGLA